jgi:hypothetical protein
MLKSPDALLTPDTRFASMAGGIDETGAVRSMKSATCTLWCNHWSLAPLSLSTSLSSSIRHGMRLSILGSHTILFPWLSNEGIRPWNSRCERSSPLKGPEDRRQRAGTDADAGVAHLYAQFRAAAARRDYTPPPGGV